MQVFSPAKINLTLNVGPAQPSGYHLVDSVFHLTNFGDYITVSPAEKLEVTCSVDLQIDPTDNLAYRAAVALGEEFKQPTDIRIHIDKHLPHGAGLGGGSSNAAAVIRVLAQQWGVEPNDERCLGVANRLGADIAVFLMDTSASDMTHYGERLKRSLPGAAGVPVVLAMHPDSHVSTPAAYRAFDENPQPTQSQDELVALLDEMADRVWQADDISRLAALLYSNLALAAEAVAPQVGEVKDFLASHPLSKGSIVSGSGAACFALCGTDDEALELADACMQKGYWAVATTLA